MCFQEHLSSLGAWCLTEMLYFACDSGKEEKLNSFLLVCRVKPQKALFYFCTWQNISINIFKNRLDFFTSPTRPGGCVRRHQKPSAEPRPCLFSHFSVCPKFLRQSGNARAFPALCNMKQGCMNVLMVQNGSLCVRVCARASRNSKAEPARRQQRLRQTVQTIPSIPPRSRVNWPRAPFLFCHTGWDTDAWVRAFGGGTASWWEAS